MKKLALLATAAVSIAVADAPVAATGFYAGANVGIANTNVKYNMANTGTIAAGGQPATAYNQNFSVEAGKMGLQYGLLGGYNMGLGNGAVVGVELFVGGDSSKVKNMTDSSGAAYNIGKESVKRTMYYGFAPRVGYMITPSVLAYVRLGVEGGKWKAEYAPDQGAIDSTAVTGTADAKTAAKKVKTASKNRINFAPGVGLDVFASKNVFMRVQYHYVFGPKITIQWPEMAGLTSGLFNGTNQTRQYKISQHVVSFAVGYKF